jgi:hypothetical protein
MPWHDPSFGTANFSHQGFGMERLPMARGWLGAGVGSDWLGHGFGGGNEGFDWTEHWRKLGFPDMNDVLAGSPSERSGYDSLSLFDKWKYQPARAFENTLKEAASASLMALPVVGPMARAAAAGRVGVTFAVTRMAPSVAKRGGMLGSQRTRQHVAAVAAEMESRGWAITHGGGRFPEEYLPGPGGGRLGSSFVDITAVKNGRTLRVNTVDTYANGITPTKREAANALRIRSQTPGDHLLLVPKPKPKP